MSSGQSPSVTELAAFIFQLETFYAENLCWISIAALTAYDYLITFEHEVNFFWNRMFTGTTVLFLMNRYFSLFTFAIYACIASPKEFERCVVTYYITVFIEGFYYIPWAAFSALRAYALCGQKWPFPILIFILGLAPVVTNYYANLHVVLVPAAPGGAVGCEAINPSITPAIVRILLYVTRGALILADIIVLAITWSATYQLSKQNRALRKASSLSEILLRDGTVYFVALLMANVIHLVFSSANIAETFINRVATSYVPIVAEALTAIMVSRFLIDLQRVNRNITQGGSDLDSRPSDGGRSVIFNRVIGTMGSSVSAPWDDHTVANEDTGAEGHVNEEGLQGEEECQSKKPSV